MKRLRQQHHPQQVAPSSCPPRCCGATPCVRCGGRNGCQARRRRHRHRPMHTLSCSLCGSCGRSNVGAGGRSRRCSGWRTRTTCNQSRRFRAMKHSSRMRLVRHRLAWPRLCYSYQICINLIGLFVIFYEDTFAILRLMVYQIRCEIGYYLLLFIMPILLIIFPQTKMKTQKVK